MLDLDQFLADLRGTEDDTHLEDFCRKHVLHGTPRLFEAREGDFYEFRKKVAVKFGIAFREVFITGSAMLGFSPHKRTQFSLDSDVDLAIVSSELFDRMLEAIREYQMQLRRSRRKVTEWELRTYHQFLEYTALGWIRPDKLPVSFEVGVLKNDWFEFFRGLSNGNSEVGDYKVTGGVFRTYRHLELYVVSGYKDLRTSLQLEADK